MCFFFFFKQKTAYEMRISDWSSDVCSSDLGPGGIADIAPAAQMPLADMCCRIAGILEQPRDRRQLGIEPIGLSGRCIERAIADIVDEPDLGRETPGHEAGARRRADRRSEEHTSELQSLMRISSAVFCLKKTQTTQSQN